MQFLRPFSRYFEFSGRSGRAEFWQYFALLIGLSSVVQILEFNALMESIATGLPHISGLTIIFNLATIIPTTAVAFRRLHDRGLSGWVLGASYIAILPFFVVLGAAIAGMIDNSGQTSLGPLLMGMGASLMVYEIYLLVQLASPGDDFENFYGLPDNAPFHPFRSVQTSRSLSATLSSEDDNQYGGTDGNRGQIDNVVSTIERLASLHSVGHLTDDEFAAQKGRLLAGLN